MVNWQLSKQGVCWPASHEEPTQVPIHRGVFPLSSYKLYIDRRLKFMFLAGPQKSYGPPLKLSTDLRISL